MKVWNDYYFNRVKEILASCSDTHQGFQEALALINEEFPFRVSESSMYHAMRRNGHGKPADYLGKNWEPKTKAQDDEVQEMRAVAPKGPRRASRREVLGEPPPPQSLPHQPMPQPRASSSGESRRAALEDLERFAPLYEMVKKGPVSFRALCDKLDMSPSRATKFLDEAQKAGIEVTVAHDHVGIDADAPRDVQDTHIPPVVGERQTVAVISDTHLGSKYCMRAQLQDFIHYAYEERGVRTILHVGDVLDGNYHHSVFELTHSGLEDQTFDLIETLPQREGLTYHGITGNHDETFWKKSGVNVGRVIEAHFQDAGRNDMFFYGDRDAFLKVNGIVVHLWHPTGSAAYAKSYHPQKKVESYMHIKPQILLCGHWHQYCHIYERGVHAIACPTFQGSMSRFSRSLKGNQAQGGLVLSWDLTEYGMIRNFILEPRFYYEVERPVEIHNHIDARGVEPAVSRPTAQTAGSGVRPWHHKQR